MFVMQLICASSGSGGSDGGFRLLLLESEEVDTSIEGNLRLDWERLDGMLNGEDDDGIEDGDEMWNEVEG